MLSAKKIRVDDALIVVLILSVSAVAEAATTTNIQGSLCPCDRSNPVTSITISWPAFTTRLKEQVDSGNVMAAVAEDGHFSVDLIPNADSQPNGTLYTAEYHANNGSSHRESWLVPAQPEATLAQVRVEQSASIPASQSQEPVPPADSRRNNIDHRTEIQQLGFQGERPRSQAPSLSHYTDASQQHLGDFFHDPDRNSYSNQNDSWLQVCNYTSEPGWAGANAGWTGSKNNCMNQFSFNASPGVDFGNPRVGPGGWSGHFAIRLNSVVNSPGISELIGANQVKAGIGDNTGYYFYNTNYGGAVAASDEGNHLTAAGGGEQATVYTGSVIRGGQGATSVKVNCAADCEYPGDGRYLIDIQQPIVSGYVTAKTNPTGALTPGTFTIDPSVTPSTAWGILAADVATPAATEIGTGHTDMTFKVNVAHGQFAPGSLVCFGGQFHEQALVSSVNGSGLVTLTVPLRHAHESGSWIMQGGPCGSFIEFTANTVSPEKQKIRYPIDILGATDSHTLVYRYFAYSTGTFAGGYWKGNVTFAKVPITHLSNSGGVVTMIPSAGSPAQHPEFYNTDSVYISNAADSRFNGICTDTKITPSGQLSCMQSSSTGATSATGELSYGSSASGNTAFNLWPGAEVLDVLDHSVAPPTVNGTFTLEPNSARWNINDGIENVHHYAASIDAQHIALSIYNPMKLNGQSRLLWLDGGGISGGNPGQPTFYTADRIWNAEPATNYAYHGGTVTPPGGIFLGGNRNAGLFNYGLAMQYAPDPPGSSALYIGCPASGCSDSAFYYSFLTLQGNGGDSTLNYTPATNILSFSGKGLNLKDEPLLGTTLRSEKSGAPASLNFSSIDSSGQTHTWALNAPPTGGGFNVNLPQAGGTLALNNAFGASGPSHSAGMVPDPGSNAGATRFLREDGKWVAICGNETASTASPFHPAVLRRISDGDDTSLPAQLRFPVVVAKASYDAQDTALDNVVNYLPEKDGTFRVTVSVYLESPCDSGTLIVNASLSPAVGHEVGEAQRRDCTEAYSNITAMTTAHSAAGVPIRAGVGLSEARVGSLRYRVDAIVEQLQ